MYRLPFSHRTKIFLGLTGILLGFLLINLLVTSKQDVARATDHRSIYTDQLQSGWQDWSWGQPINWQSSTVFEGEYAIHWQPHTYHGIFFHHTPFIIEDDQILQFAFQSDAPNHLYTLIPYGNENKQLQPINIAPYRMDHLQQEKWEIYQIPLLELNPTEKILTGFAIQFVPTYNQAQRAQVFIDDIHITTPSENQPQSLPENTEVILNEGQLSDKWEHWAWNGNIDFNFQDEFGSLANWQAEQYGGVYFNAINQPEEQNAQKEVTVTYWSTKLPEQLLVWHYNLQGKPIKSEYLSIPDQPYDQWNTISFKLSPETTGFGLQNIINQDLDLKIQSIHLTTRLEEIPSIQPDTNSQTPTATPTLIQKTQAVQTSPTTNTITAGAYHTQNGQIYHQDSKINLQGVNWFGFDTDTHVVHGLWTRNWQDMISQIKQLGFNSVRLPLCPIVLDNASVDSINYSLNPDLEGLNSSQVLDKIMEEMNKQQLYILVDHHRPDCQNITNLWYTDSYSEQQWITDLTTMATRWQHLPYFMGIDIKNEPHGEATWGTGDTRTDWKLAAEKAGQAIHKANPNLLIFVQGVQQNPINSVGDSHWWGGNFEPYKVDPISSQAIPSNKLVLSPHVYGPDVHSQAYFDSPEFPNNMEKIWERDFGYLTDHQIVLAPGEWGGFYGTHNPKDKIWQDRIVDYFISKQICNSYYWSFNPNSGDTGGILQDDWKTPVQSKLNLLGRLYQNCK